LPCHARTGRFNTELGRRVDERTAEALRRTNLLDLANDAISIRGAETDKLTYWDRGAEWPAGKLGDRPKHPSVVANELSRADRRDSRAVLA
jgi:hypothetical protein